MADLGEGHPRSKFFFGGGGLHLNFRPVGLEKFWGPNLTKRSGSATGDMENSKLKLLFRALDDLKCGLSFNYISDLVT